MNEGPVSPNKCRSPKKTQLMEIRIVQDKAKKPKRTSHTRNKAVADENLRA